MTENENKHLVDVRQIPTDIFNPVVWEQMKGMADVFVKSGAFTQDENASKLMVKMQAGREMGMKPLEAVKAFYFVKGTLNIFGAALTRRLREHGWRIEYKDEPNKCTATISKGDESYTDSLTFEEAEKSKWTQAWDNTSKQYKLKPGWIEGANRKLKLRYGVLSLMIKTYVPEVLGSAVDIAEIAIDAAPVISGEEVMQPVVEKEAEPATEAQVKTLTSLGYEFEDGTESLTFKEASQKILELSREPKLEKEAA